MTIPARYNHTQQIDYLRKTIGYNDAGLSAGVPIGALPAGAQIVDIVANVTTAFNAGTTNVVTVGTTALGNNIISAADVNEAATGFTRVTTGGTLTFANDQTIYASYTQTGTAATAGQVTIVITFVPNNDL